MLRAIFIDYTGTTIQESSPEMVEVVTRICKNSKLKQPYDVMNVWWSLIKEYEINSYGELYISGDEIVDKSLSALVENYQLNDDVNELHKLIQSFWINAPIFSDVKEFYEKCPLPLYVISNNGEHYVKRAMEINKLTPKGIICADAVKAYKPHKELFEKALEVSATSPEEVLHIGDSYNSDVKGALSCGIKPILLDREGKKEYKDIVTVKSLIEVLSMLSTDNLL